MSYNFITNSYGDGSLNAPAVPVPAKTPVVLRVKDDLDPSRVLSLFNTANETANNAIHDVGVVQNDVIVLQNDVVAIDTNVTDLQTSLSNTNVVVNTNTVNIAAINTDLTSIDTQLTTLNDGVIVSDSLHSSNTFGGTALTVTPATTTIPTQLSLDTFDATGTIYSSVILTSTDVAIFPKLVLRDVADVGAAIVDIQNKQLADEIATAAEFAANAAEFAALALEGLKPPIPGFQALPPEQAGVEEQPPEEDTVSFCPLYLKPPGSFASTDASGNITTTINPIGKCGLNQTLPTRCFDMVGDFRQKINNDAIQDSAFETQGQTTLGSKVAQYDTSQPPKLTNPTTPAVYLGPNALATCAGELNSASVVTETIFAGAVTAQTVNGVQPLKSLHVAQGLSKDYSAQIGTVAQKLIATQRRLPKASVQKDYRDDIATQANRITETQRLIKPVVTKDWSAAMEQQSNRITETNRLIPRFVAADYRPAIAEQAGRITEVQRLIKPSVAKDYSREIAVLKQSAAQPSRAVHDLSYDPRPAIAALHNKVSSSNNTPTRSASKNYDPAIAKLHSLLGSVQAGHNTSRALSGDYKSFIHKSIYNTLGNCYLSTTLTNFVIWNESVEISGGLNVLSGLSVTGRPITVISSSPAFPATTNTGAAVILAPNLSNGGHDSVAIGTSSDSGYWQNVPTGGQFDWCSNGTSFATLAPGITGFFMPGNSNIWLGYVNPTTDLPYVRLCTGGPGYLDWNGGPMNFRHGYIGTNLTTVCSMNETGFFTSNGLQCNGTLYVTGQTTLNGATNINGVLTCLLTPVFEENITVLGNGVINGTLSVEGDMTAPQITAVSMYAGGYHCRSGINAPGYGGNQFNWYWTGYAMQCWVDATEVGVVSFTSDYRVKQKIQPLADGALDIVAKLKPCTFEWATAGVFKADGVQQSGFIAHEIVDAGVVHGAHGKKDAVDDKGNMLLQSVDSLALIAVLTKGIQELVARVAVLEQAAQSAPNNIKK